MATPRRRVGALVTALLAFAAVFAAATPSYAEDGYRYWNYSHLQGDTFVFADTGPGDFTPKDGDVEGWRYGTSTVSTGIEPRADLSQVNFDSVCGDLEAGAGEKRVAVVVDYGVEADADGAEIPEPTADCAVVPEKANGQQTLGSVVDVRSDNDLVCALDGYPVKGCGDPVKDAQVQTDEATVGFVIPAAATDEPSLTAGGDTAQAAEESDEGGVSPLLIGVVVIAALLAGLAAIMYRRNRES